MELTFDRGACLAVFREQGGPGMVDTLDLACFMAGGHRLGLYSMSADWTYIDAVKRIKCRGTVGDLVVHLA
jgi:hypothetical protein